MTGQQARLERWEHRTEWPLAMMAVIFVASYTVRVLAQPRAAEAHAVDAVMMTSWVAFVADYVVRLLLAPGRRRWFIRHLLDLVIVVLPVMQPLRFLWLTRVAGALQRAGDDAVHRRVTAYAITSAILVVYVASLAELQVERHDAQTTINSFGKAVFWSITTVTTVGYGFEHPTTPIGRAIAALLMICGISLVGTVTATVASWIVRLIGEGSSAAPAITAEHIEQLRSEIQALRSHLDQTGAIPSPTDLSGQQ